MSLPAIAVVLDSAAAICRWLMPAASSDLISSRLLIDGLLTEGLFTKFLTARSAHTASAIGEIDNANAPRGMREKTDSGSRCRPRPVKS